MVSITKLSQKSREKSHAGECERHIHINSIGHGGTLRHTPSTTWAFPTAIKWCVIECVCVCVFLLLVMLTSCAGRLVLRTYNDSNDAALKWMCENEHGNWLRKSLIGRGGCEICTRRRRLPYKQTQLYGLWVVCSAARRFISIFFWFCVRIRVTVKSQTNVNACDCDHFQFFDTWCLSSVICSCSS